jgi:hypothetical protein
MPALLEKWKNKSRALLGKYWWLWSGCLVLAVAINLATAVLRLDSFFPTPRSIDLSSYYAGAWSLRLHLSPYPWSEGLLRFLGETQNLAVENTPLNSPPLWPWLLQPLTLLSFPAAAVAWLFLLLLTVGCSHVLLLRIAGYHDWRTVALTLPFTLTFGPLFLNLTIGQNGPFLLLAALLLGEALRNRSGKRKLLAAMAVWVVAVAGKIYPALWIGCLPLLKRWRLFAGAVALCLAAFAVVAVLAPQASHDYWFNTLLNQTKAYSSEVSINDQSLNGYLKRVGASGTYAFPGLNVDEWPEEAWSWPWEFSAAAIRIFSSLILLGVGLFLAYAWRRNQARDPDAALYSTVLFTLLLVPHLERYNHIVALPALAWLWGAGGGYRRLAIAAFGLFALSRLTHLWAALSLPGGLLASGFGLFAVLVLILGIPHRLVKTAKPIPGEA